MTKTAKVKVSALDTEIQIHLYGERPKPPKRQEPIEHSLEFWSYSGEIMMTRYNDETSLSLGFNSFEASSTETKEIKFVKAQKNVCSDGGLIIMGNPLNDSAALKINVGPPPVTHGSEKTVSFQKSILGPRPKHIIVNKVKVPIASDNEVKQFYKPLSKPGVRSSKPNFRSKTPPSRSVNNNYSRPKTPQPKRYVGRQNQPHGFPIPTNYQGIADALTLKRCQPKALSTYKATMEVTHLGSNLRGNIIGNGYSQNSKAYIILNKHTRKVKESLNVTFDETPPPSKTSPLVDDDLDEEEAIKVTKKKNLENDIMDETLEIDKIGDIKESRNHPLENVIGNLNQRTLRSQAQNQSNFFCFISTIEPKNVNEALGDERTKWVFRNKLDENGVVSRNNARLVAQGYNQQEGINYVPWSSRDANRAIPVNETLHEQTDDELTKKELKQVEADDQAIQTILLSLPGDIYAAVDSCETAQEIYTKCQASGCSECNVGNQNRLIVVPGIANQNPNGNGNVVAAQAEGNAIGNNGN
ncbi:retrovirus-related pol polyprotein from transposon TNT 1-94 [Tanacetum coccineum]